MNVPLPIHVIKTSKQWNLYLCKHVPALDKLYRQGKFEQFETYKTMCELDYETFFRSHVEPGIIYAPYIPLVITKEILDEHTNA